MPIRRRIHPAESAAVMGKGLNRAGGNLNVAASFKC
jgi:hypothetical protein